VNPNLLVIPIMAPFLAAASALLWRSRRAAQRTLALTGALGILASGMVLVSAVARSGPLVLRFGDWPAPFGIVFAADLLSAILVALTGLVGVAVVIFSFAAIDARREHFGFYPLLLILLMGVCGAFLTGDVFNLYVWFEVLLIASFVLLALGSERAQMEGAIKYVAINLIASMLFLVAVGLLYAEAGTLTMADLARVLPGAANPGLITAIAALFMVAFGIKAAMFPLYFWLPASYHTPPPVVSAVFAGLLTKVGVYALLRLFTLVFVGDVGYTHTVVLVASGATMVVGVLGALVQSEMRRILSFLIVSHIGFAVMGLGLYTPAGLAGAVFYIVEDMIVLTGLFLAAGIITHVSPDDDLQHLGGFFGAAPLFALLFLLPALSLAGVPPLSGFFAKLALLRAGLEVGQYGIVAAAIITSVLTLLAVTRIWSEVFWKPNPRQQPLDVPGLSPASAPLWLPVAVLAACVVALGAAVGPAFALATHAGQQLFDPSAYIAAVLEDGR
jgi:multicomponent Na+:H+ antiporter subunit D